MRLVDCEIDFEFDDFSEKLKKEFDLLGAEMDDPIGQYIKIAKARGETRDTDKVLLELLIALHRKVDELTAYIKNEKKEYLPLKFKTKIVGVGFEGFKISDKILEKNKKYYGRMDLPVFPERKVPVIFLGIDEDLAEIVHMHDRDIKDYNGFITARERAIIREMKAKR